MSKISCDAPSLRESLSKRARPHYSDHRWGILNPYGDIWTSDTFETRSAAAAHVVDFWSREGFTAADQSPSNINRFRVVPVKVTVSLSNRKDGSSQQDSADGSK